jgi:hypothetical protein
MNILTIVDQLKYKNKLSQCTKDEIDEAEQELGLVFADEYKELLLGYGSLETKHLLISSTLKNISVNVVTLTQQIRSIYDNLPKDLYVIMDSGVDGIIIFQDSKGKIYETSHDDTIMEAYDSLAHFISDIEETG